jgi:L-aminopeptidase/D-esterase-like protein
VHATPGGPVTVATREDKNFKDVRQPDLKPRRRKYAEARTNVHSPEAQAGTIGQGTGAESAKGE